LTPLPHPRDGSRIAASSEVLEAEFEAALDMAGIEREASLMVTAATAIANLRARERELDQYRAWERYVTARHEYIVDREQHARKGQA
jgi:hypothetical protein